MDDNATSKRQPPKLGVIDRAERQRPRRPAAAVRARRAVKADMSDRGERFVPHHHREPKRKR